MSEESLSWSARSLHARPFPMNLHGQSIGCREHDYRKQQLQNLKKILSPYGDALNGCPKLEFGKLQHDRH